MRCLDTGEFREVVRGPSQPSKILQTGHGARQLRLSPCRLILEHVASRQLDMQSEGEGKIVKEFSNLHALGPMCGGDPGGTMCGIDVDQLRTREDAMGFSICIGCYMSIKKDGAGT